MNRSILASDPTSPTITTVKSHDFRFASSGMPMAGLMRETESGKQAFEAPKRSLCVSSTRTAINERHGIPAAQERETRLNVHRVVILGGLKQDNMTARAKRPPSLFWPYHYFGPWTHAQHPPYAIAPWWHSRWGREEEKEHLAAYIGFLKAELEAAEEYLEQLDKMDADDDTASVEIVKDERVGMLTQEQVRDILGPVGEHKVDAIVAIGAKPEDIVEAQAMATGKRDVTGSGEQPLPGSVMAVYLILTSGEG